AHERVVLPPDELRSGPIEEGHVHGAQRGPDETDDQEQRGRAPENHQREEGAGALHPTIGRSRDEEQHGKNSEEGKDDPRHLDELIARGEPHRYLSSPHSKTGSAASSTRPSRQWRGTPFFRETQAMGRPARRPTARAHQRQELSISSSASSADVEPSIQSVIAVQNEPAPTSAGIMSEPSKREVAVSSWSSSIARRRMSDDAFSGSPPVFADVTPPMETRLFAQCSEAR